MEQLKREHIDVAEDIVVTPESSSKIDLTNIIGQAHTLEELFDILENVGEIEGKTGVYKSEDLVSQIQAVENKQASLETITKTFGIREKVLELLGENILSKELEERKIIEQVSLAQSIEELVSICSQIESIDTASGPVSGKEIASIIDQVEHKLLPLEAITRTDGIRDKVHELLGDTVISEELEERAQIEELQNSLKETNEEGQENILEKTKKEYEAIQVQYQQAYENHRNLIAGQPTGIKKLFSFFSNKPDMKASEENVNSLKAQLEEKESEYKELQEKIVEFHN